MINATTKNNSGEKGVFGLSFKVTIHHGNMVVLGQELKQKCCKNAVLFDGLYDDLCSTIFIIQPRTTYFIRIPPAVDGASLHHLAIKTMNSP